MLFLIAGTAYARIISPHIISSATSFLICRP